MMIAMRSTPSGIVTFKDLRCFYKREKSSFSKRSSFFTLCNHKNNHKNNDDAVNTLLV